MKNIAIPSSILIQTICTAIFSLFLLQGCSQDKPLEESGDFTFEVSDVPDNALRKTVSIHTASPAPCHVEFWSLPDRSDLRATRLYDAADHHEITLLMMKEDRQYSCQAVFADGRRSQELSFRTGRADEDIHAFIGDTAGALDGKCRFDGFVLYIDKNSNYMFMVDDQAEIVWYQRFSPEINSSFSYDPLRQCISQMHGLGETQHATAFISSMDLYGNVLMKKAGTELEHGEMHHDIIRMKDGNWLYTHFVRRDYDFTPLGVPEVKTVTGDGLCIINAEGETLWEWNCFDHLNPLEDPDILLSEKKPNIDNFMHTNSVVEDANGDLYLSSNRMKQFMKISRKTGDVVFRLGFNGNVGIDRQYWPDRLHSLVLLGQDDPKGPEILLFENGDRDREYSRILSYRVNEKGKTAECLTDITLPLSLRSHYNSSAYRLEDGNYLVHSTAKELTAVVSPSGEILWSLPVHGVTFRAIRVPDARF